MKKMSMCFPVGATIIVTMILLRQFEVHLPDFVMGLGYGVGIALELIGVYSMNNDTSKWRQFNLNLFGR
ncbi:hypothetical protein [Aquibacillus kalidii]|uniref:hypothetical protein n=1 Tax=Aquibacillus kalidii TaxID=2762597 RepID=UPI001646A0B9|nr:hypothetical protein [Aquibacillus kalidii]